MKNALLVTALLATVGYGGWRLTHRGEAPVVTDDSKLTLDRIWVDHLPRTDKDTFQIFAAISEEEFGVFQQTSSWKGNFELFTFKFAGDKIKATFPQDGDREEIKVKATPCNEGQMDYCLEIAGSKRGVKKYYSRKGWEIDGVHSAKALEERTESIATELEATLPSE
jgi:hypothetical protein